MKAINDKYFIETDRYNIILLEKKISKKGKNIGKEYFDNIGYFTNLESLYKSIIEKEIKDDFGLVSDIAKVVELINGFKLKE